MRQTETKAPNKILNYLKYGVIGAVFITLFALSSAGVILPTWAFWIIGAGVFGFVTWRLIKAFIEQWKKSKTDKERRGVIYAIIFTAFLGIGVYFIFKASGLGRILFPGWIS